MSKKIAGHLSERANGGDVLNAVTLLGVTQADALDALPDGQQRLDEVDGDGETWRDQRGRQRAEELAVEDDAELFVVQAGQVINVPPAV